LQNCIRISVVIRPLAQSNADPDFHFRTAQ
jgi:hypothetical protein